MLDKLIQGLDPFLIRFSIFCASLGLIVSLVACLLGGAGFPALLYRPFLYAFLMIMVATASYYFLKMTFPGIIKAIESLNDAAAGFDDLYDLESDEDDLALDLDDSSDDNVSAGSVDVGDLHSITNSPGARQATAKAGEILVKGVPIKNEPKLMAKAIKHLLDKDED